jgi:hypothetical protein
LAVWDKDEAIALDLLTQRIPGSTVIWTMNLNSAAIMWAEIIREYTEKGTMAQTDLCTDFLQSKCPDRGDVREWLNSLWVKKEVLAEAGVTVSEEDFRSTIISL